VPLILRGIGLAAGRRVETPVSIKDVAATILDVVPGRGGELPGRSLLAHLESIGAYSHRRQQSA